MKVGFISDSHGNYEQFKRGFEKLIEQVDFVVHLGDILNHGPRNPILDTYAPMELAEFIKEKMRRGRLLLVKGNCDSDVDESVLEVKLAPFLVLKVGDKTIVAAHEPEKIEIAKAYAADMFVHGHTHQRRDEVVNGIRVLNPSSCAIAKDKNSVMVLDVETQETEWIEI